MKKFFSPVHGKALEGHVFKTLELPRQDMCRVNCYLEDSCQSYNLASSEQNDSWECELSSTEHIQHPGSLVNSPSKVYHATQVPLTFLFRCFVALLFIEHFHTLGRPSSKTKTKKSKLF